MNASVSFQRRSDSASTLSGVARAKRAFSCAEEKFAILKATATIWRRLSYGSITSFKALPTSKAISVGGKLMMLSAGADSAVAADVLGTPSVSGMEHLRA